MAAPKEYGLIKRGPKTSVPVIAKPSIFDDSSDEEAGPHSVGKKLQKEADRVQNRKQVKLDISLAISEDPTVYQYDEIYDDLVKKKEEQVAVRKTKVDNKPRYIDSLLKTAKARKLDQERSYERKVHKEREAEGEKFADKDAFVTSAYKKKMLEMEELDEKDKIEAAIEARNDVTKQTDLRGFYQTLYHQTVGKDTPDSNDLEDSSKGEASKSSSVTVIKEEPKSESDEEKSNSVNSKEKPRQWRSRRKNSESSGESEVEKSSRERVKERTRRDRRESSSETKGRTGRRRSASREGQPKSSKRETRHRSNRGRESSSSDRSHKTSDKRSRKDGDNSSNRKRRASVSSETSDNSVSNAKRDKRSTSRRESNRGHHENDNRDSSRKVIRDRDKHVDVDKTIKKEKVKSEERQETEKRDDKNVDSSSGEPHVKPKDSAIVKRDPAVILEKLNEIFKKRHTATAFEDARNRFLMRKADRK